MKPRYQATRTAIDLIKRFEGFRAKAASLPDGRWTIGYGHIKSARAGAEVSEADAEALLIYDVAAVATAINEWVYSPLTQNQFDALTAFAFNIGLQNFRKCSVLRRLNEGAYLQAACALEMWRSADFEDERIVVDALVRRRSAEMTLFLTPPDGFIPVPSLVVRPRVDETVARTAHGAVTEIQTPLDSAIAAAQRAEEAEPVSAAISAAAAMTARLNAMFRDAGDGPMEAEAAYASEPPQAASVQPARVHAEPASFAPAEPETDVDLEEARPTLEPHPLFHATPLVFRAIPEGPVGRRRKAQTSAPMLVLMGLTGLGVAGAGPFWGFSANAPGHSPILPDPQMAGLGLALIGVSLLAASVYMLLTRLAGHSE